MRLFIERAQAVRADFAVTDENAPRGRRDLRAAGWAAAGDRAGGRAQQAVPAPGAAGAARPSALALLTGGARDLPARQQTLRDAIAWSYDLLDAAEQALFARLGVFVGGCTLEAAEAVLATTGWRRRRADCLYPASTVLDGLASLVDKSLLRQVEGWTASRAS